ncbi:TPA: aminotransferase class III-fold pyridoxal phosphate-dependent enzyme [Pseudomonas aeruginosa]
MSGEAREGLRSPWLQAGRLAFLALFGVTLLAALAWAFSNVRQIGPENRAVVLRLGALERLAGPGLLLAWPQPLEQVVLLPSAEQVIERRVEGLLRSEQARRADLDVSLSSDALAGSGYLLTGDAGVVQLDVRVFYKVDDPYAYVLQGAHVLPALDRLVARNAVQVCAARDLDTILVARPELLGNDSAVAERRERLRGDLVQGINHSLAALAAAGSGLGIQVVRVDVQSSLPLAVVVYREWLDKWQPGAHAGTFRGNQMAMAAGSAVMRYLKEHDLAAHAAAMGERLAEHLRILQRDYPQLGDIRGRGLMLGVEIVDPQGEADALGHPPTDGALASRVQRECLRRGLILELGGRHGSVVRFLPPLIIGAEQIDEVARRFARALGAALAG